MNDQRRWWVKVRALVLTALGTPVLAGLLVSTLMLGVRFYGTSLAHTRFWMATATFGVFSLIALGVILRANRRVRRTGEQGLGTGLARWAPLLILLGAIAGAIGSWVMSSSILKSRAEYHAEECALVAPAAIDTCLPVMSQCYLETLDGPGLTIDRTGKLAVDWPAGLKMPENDARARARLLCAWQALHPTP